MPGKEGTFDVTQTVMQNGLQMHNNNCVVMETTQKQHSPKWNSMQCKRIFKESEGEIENSFLDKRFYQTPL